MSWDGFFFSWDHLRQNLYDFFRLSPPSVCRLNTVDRDGILVADNSCMVSLLEIRGSLRLVGEEEFETACSTLANILQTPLSKPAHAIQMVFSYDPAQARSNIAKLMKPIRVSAKNLRLDLDGVLADWQDTIAGYCAEEKVIMAVWTKPNIMTAAELRKVQRESRAQERMYVRTGDAQTDAFIVERMRDIHAAVVKDVASNFKALNYKVKVYGSHDAVHCIRSMNVPEYTASNWRACLPGDPYPLRVPEPGAGKADMTSYAWPSLAKQIWPCSAIFHEKKYIEVGERVYAPFIMTLPPQTPLPFNVLFRSMLSENIPWRCSILLTGDGMHGQGLKNVAASILSFTSGSNKMIQQSYKQLEELSMAGEGSVVFQAAFTTWVHKNEVADDKELWHILPQRIARLMTAVQSWGSCDTTAATGDPLLLYAATLPGLSPSSPAVKSIAPLSDAVHLLPFARPCSPWDAPDVPLRTSDGKFMPVGLFNSNQASWNEIAFAGMGAGKSFFLNTLNFFFVVRPGQTRLPWLTVIDVGVSCSGVINLIKAALPPDLKHLAMFARLRNTASNAINPFDTPLGCPYPLPNHAGFLLNLISLLCTAPNETAPVDGVPDLLHEAVEKTYRDLAPNGDCPHKYDPYADEEISRWIAENHYELDNATTWWELVKALFKAGNIPLAVRAQHFASPILSDIMSSINNQLVRERFEKITVKGSGETIPNACVRYLTTAIQKYPILANPTKFDIGAAQIIGLDLQEVTPRGGPEAERQSGIMYMLARFCGAGHFFNTAADMDRIPDLYKPYHKPRFEHLVSDPKRLCYDEFHRASCADPNNPLSRQIIADLTTASRESRKQNLSIGLYSQQLSDFPKVLVDLATSVYALGAGNAQEAQEIADRFGLNQAAHYALRRITRPTKAGANFVAMFRTSDGESIQYLTNTAGSYAKWAFSTTAEDMAVRNRLYEVLGCARALEILRTAYPDGSVKDEIERRKLTMEAHDGEAAEDLSDQIVRELLELAKTA